jgi:hypothetical protein
MKRAVVLQFRYFDKSETMGLQTKISISQMRRIVVSPGISADI